MTNTMHTPGPWTMETMRTSVGICHKIGPFPAKDDDGEPRHACLYADYPSTSNPRDEELRANARLIAAAPDLLEALQTLLDSVEGNRVTAGDCYMALAAITKATKEMP